jgi:hypothetical protein
MISEAILGLVRRITCERHDRVLLSKLEEFTE